MSKWYGDLKYGLVYLFQVGDKLPWGIICCKGSMQLQFHRKRKVNRPSRTTSCGSSIVRSSSPWEELGVDGGTLKATGGTRVSCMLILRKVPALLCSAHLLTLAALFSRGHVPSDGKWLSLRSSSPCPLLHASQTRPQALASGANLRTTPRRQD